MCALKLSAFTPTIGTATATISWRLYPTHCNFFYDFTKRPRRTRLNRLKPSCSLKETQTQIQKHKVSSASPRLESSEPPSDGEPAQSSDSPDDNPNNAALAEGKGEGFFDVDTAFKGTLLAGLVLVAVVGGLGSVAFIYKDQLNAFLIDFSSVLEGYGPAGYALFVAVYAGLEILAIPAVPLTMSAGLLFGNVTGTIIVSVSGTIAATVSFLIARYFARERIAKLVEGNKKFAAIDKAIGENGFGVVTLLRLSPLLPFSLGNYLYGLTSVQLFPYVLGSWLGMLPGTWAYVSAGAFGRAFIQEEAEGGLPGGNEQLLTLGLGLLVTAVAATYVTRLAKKRSIQEKDSLPILPFLSSHSCIELYQNQTVILTSISSIDESGNAILACRLSKPVSSLLQCGTKPASSIVYLNLGDKHNNAKF